jgi:hypothetical protein
VALLEDPESDVRSAAERALSRQSALPEHALEPLVALLVMPTLLLSHTTLSDGCLGSLLSAAFPAVSCRAFGCVPCLWLPLTLVSNQA